MKPELQFAQPLWIWIGLAICVALAFGVAGWNRRRKRDLQKLAHSRLLRQLTKSLSRKRRSLKQGLWLVALFLVFVAAARPQYGFEYREVKRRGIDIVFAVDTSRSMLAEDVAPNRLERAKLAITDFVEKLRGDRVGLIPFAGNAFSLCPLTLDYGAFFQSLDALDTHIIPHQGTDLATAVREANRLFEKEGNNHRILVLVTDGEDLQGAVMDAVATAKEKGMIIHTVGVGDPKGALIPISQEDGSQDFVRDENGTPVRTALDEKTLKQIAKAIGGTYAPLGNAGQGLETIYQEKLRLVPKSDFDQRLDRIPLERYEWPLAAAILLLLLEFLTGERRRYCRREAPVISAARRKKATAAMATLVMLVAFPVGNAIAKDQAQKAGDAPRTQTGPTPEQPPAEATEPKPATDFTDPRAAYNAGTSAYRNSDFARAEETLDHTLGRTDDLSLQQRSYYNLGNARYRLGQQTQKQNPKSTMAKWEEAVKSYNDALALNPDDEDARFNRDFVRKKLDELKKQQQQKQQQQQQQQQNKDQQQDQKQGGKSQSKADQQKSSSGKDKDQDQKKQDESQGEKPEKPYQQKSEGKQKPKEPGSNDTESQKDHSQPKPEEAGKKPKEQQPGSGKPKDEPKQEKAPQPQPGDQEKASQPKEEAPDIPPAQPKNEQSEEKRSNQKPGAPGSFSEERREPGEMSKEEAAQLLEALRQDERSVIPLPDARTHRQAVPNNTTKGKTW